MDEHKGRKLAIKEGLAVAGCVAILEALYCRGDITDLRDIYRELLFQKIRVDLRMLQSSLKQFGLAPL
jgi:predicted nucleic acid-binding protein